MSRRLPPHKRFLSRWIVFMEVPSMVRNELQQHEHTGPGDGGELDLANAAGTDESIPTVVASGSETTQNTTTDTDTGISDDRDVTLTASIDNAYSGTVVIQGSGTGDSTVVLRADGGTWHVRITENSDNQLDVTWRLYELS